jgi:hypothetical protein
MNKNRKTSNILNVLQYDENGHVVLPATLTVGENPHSSDNTSKIPSTSWIRTYVTGLSYLTGNQSITVSGDATGSGTTAITLTLANTAVTPGTYGSTTLVPVVTVDSKGRITSVTTAAISGSLTFTGDVTGTGTTGTSTGLTLAASGVTAGTYTKVTVDSKGRVTVGANASTTDISEGTNLYYTDARVLTYLTANSYATQSYVGTQIANLVASAPATLDTLNELSVALGNDPNFATSVATSIGTKQAQLNGTGFVKISGTTISYDNSTYLTSFTETDPIYVASSWYSTTNNASNWNTAYGWGNHASAGYLTTSTAASTYVSLTGAYANPAFVASLAYSKITGVPAFLTSYTETDPYRVTSVTVSGTSTKTITLTRADSSTVTTTWTDIDTDTNTYVTSAGFSGGNLTLTRNDTGQITVSLDGRYYLATNPSGYITGITSGQVTGALGFTPVTNARTITINGTAYDLSADRSWTITATETDTLSSVVGRGNTTGGNIISSANMYASIFYDYADNGYYLDANSYSSLWGIAIRGDNGSTGTTNQITFWGGSMTTTSAIGFKSNGAPFTNPTGNGDGYNTYLTMDTVGRGWVFRRGTGGTDFTAAYTSGWILNNGIWQANASMRAPIFYDSEDTGYYVDPNSSSSLYRINMAERIRMGVFPNSTSNSGEAWIGRASDRNAGTMTVQLGGGSASSRSFEVVDYAWSTVLFSVGSNGNISASGTITGSNLSGTNTGDQNLAPYLLKSGGTMSGTLTLASISGTAQTVSNSYGAYLHLGDWAVGRTAAGAVLVNTAYRADYATDLFDMNISRFTNNSGYLTSVGLGNMTDVHRLFNNMGNAHGTYQDFNSVGNFGVRYMQGSTNGPQSGQFYGFTLGLGNDYSISQYGSQFYWMRNTTNPYIWIRYLEGGSWNGWTKTSAGYADSAGSAPANGGNSSTVGGYSVSTGGDANTIPTRNASGYLIPQNWIQFNGNYGLYFPNHYGLHFYPNNDGSYGAAQILGDKGGWKGLHFGGGTGMTLMMNETEFGFHRQAHGWYARFTNGRFYGACDNVYNLDYALGNTHYWTAINYFQTNNGGQSVNNSNSAKLQAYSTGNNSAFMSFHKGSHYAINMGLDDDNVFRIGGWSASGNRLQMDMSGNLTMAGDVTAYSDARVKENIVTVDNALNKVLALRGVYYNRIDSDDKKTKLGVIAQEILQTVPEVVNQDNDGMFNVSYGNLAGLFIEAFKEQQKQIEELKSIIYGLTR